MRNSASSLQHPNWPLALSLLKRVSAASTGFDPEEIDGLGPNSWKSIALEGTSDPDRAAGIWSMFEPFESKLMVVVTFASYLRGVGPFFISAQGFDRLIADHADLFDDPFFSGDVTIVDVESGRIVVVHHDGLLAELQGSPVGPILE